MKMRSVALALVLMFVGMLLLGPVSAQTTEASGAFGSGQLQSILQSDSTPQQSRTRRHTVLIKNITPIEGLLQVTEIFGIAGPDFRFNLPNQPNYSLASEVAIQAAGDGNCERNGFEIICIGNFQAVSFQYDVKVIPTVEGSQISFGSGGYNGLPRDFTIEIIYPSSTRFVKASEEPISHENNTVRWFKAAATTNWVITITLEVTATTPLVTPPVVQSITAISNNSVAISWSALTEATFYELQVASDDTFPSVPISATQTISTTQPSITVQQQPGNYFFRIRGCNTTGCSPYSAIGQFTITTNENRVFLPFVGRMAEPTPPATPSGRVLFSDSVDSTNAPINPKVVFTYGIKRIYLRSTLTNVAGKQIRITASIGGSPEAHLKQEISSTSTYVYDDSVASCSGGTCGVNPLPRTSVLIRVYVDGRLTVVGSAIII